MKKSALEVAGDDRIALLIEGASHAAATRAGRYREEVTGDAAIFVDCPAELEREIQIGCSRGSTATAAACAGCGDGDQVEAVAGNGIAVAVQKHGRTGGQEYALPVDWVKYCCTVSGGIGLAVKGVHAKDIDGCGDGCVVGAA